MADSFEVSRYNKNINNDVQAKSELLSNDFIWQADNGSCKFGQQIIDQLAHDKSHYFAPHRPIIDNYLHVVLIPL